MLDDIKKIKALLFDMMLENIGYDNEIISYLEYYLPNDDDIEKVREIFKTRIDKYGLISINADSDIITNDFTAIMVCLSSTRNVKKYVLGWDKFYKKTCELSKNNMVLLTTNFDLFLHVLDKHFDS